MQLSQFTTAVLAGSGPPRQWTLLSLHRPAIFGFGMIVGATAVAIARGWLRWRRPRHARQAILASSTGRVSWTGRAVSEVPQPVSAPVAAAVAPAARSAVIWPPGANPRALSRGASGLAPPRSAQNGASQSAGGEPDLTGAARSLLARLEGLKVTLTSGPPELVGRLLTAVAEHAGAAALPGPCELVLAGFPAIVRANGGTVRCADLAAALDVIAARTVTARRRLSADGGQRLPLSVLVSSIAPAPNELSMLIDLVNEPGRLAALLPAKSAVPPGRAAVLELSNGHGHGGLTLTGPRPGRLGPARAEPTRPASLRIGVLGQLTINGQPGALLPAQTQLIVALALRGQAGLRNRQLCVLLGSDADHPKPADSLRQLIARTRRQLGRASDGAEWIEHLGQGRYALNKHARLDWHEFERLIDQGIEAGDVAQLTAALAMIRGQPFAGCYYWWLDIELVEAVGAKIVAAASTLGELELASPDPAAAARAARTGLAADPGSEQLWRLLMRAEHTAGNLAGVREAWSRCVDAVAEIAADGQPEPATVALYSQLLDR